MNDLIQQIVQRTGLPEDKVQQVVSMVLDHVKGKLPDSVSSHLDSLMAAAGSSGAGSILSGLGNMLGRKS